MDRCEIAEQLQLDAILLRGWRRVENPIKVDARCFAYVELAEEVKEFGPHTADRVERDRALDYRRQAEMLKDHPEAYHWYMGLADGIEQCLIRIRELKDKPSRPARPVQASQVGVQNG